MLISLLSVLLVATATLTNGMSDRRQRELAQTGGKYEIITFDFNEDDLSLSFTTYGKDYSLSLTLNENLILGNIKHMVNDKVHANGPNGILGSLKKSCHYHILLENNNNKYRGAISMCPRQGINGYIVIDNGNDTLIVQPAKRLLDIEYDSNPNTYYEITDKHIIYKSSNYDHTGFYDAMKKEKLRNKERDYGKEIKTPGDFSGKPKHPGNTTPQIPKKKSSEKITPPNMNRVDDNKENIDIGSIDEIQNILHNSNKLSNVNKRKLLYSTNNCEFLAMVDPDWYDYYVSAYGSNNYYDNLVSFLGNVVNGMSDLFYQTSWGNSVGTISVDFVAILVMTSFSGNYASLQPSTSGGVTQSSDYLSKLVSWSRSTGYSSSYDAIQIFVGAYSFDTGGLAYVGTVCNSNGYNTGLTGIRNGDYVYPLDTVVHIATHELGHNFNCDHDQDTTCGNDGGLMGYGSNWDEFSSCSVEFVDELFSTKDVSCLQDGIRSFTDDPDEGGNSSPTPRPTAVVTPSPTYYNPTPEPTVYNGGSDDGTDCDLYIYNLDTADGYDLNIQWYYASQHNGAPYWYGYPGGTLMYLYYEDAWSGYNIYTGDSGGSNGYAYCYTADGNILDCSSWQISSNGWAYDNDAGVYTANCDDRSDTDDNNTPSPTDRPTQAPTEYDGCNAYDCISLNNFDYTSGVNYDLNSYYEYAGCWNDKGYYGSTSTGWFVYWGGVWDGWNVNWELSDSSYPWGWCGEEVLADCDGNWWNYYNGWQQESDTFMIDCTSYVNQDAVSNNPAYTSGGGGTYTIGTNSSINDYTSFSQNCTTSYGNNICIYNSGSLWNDGVATFDFLGCKSNMPYYHYKTYSSNGTIRNYYLHYDDEQIGTTSDHWIIVKSSVSSYAAVAKCNETELTSCTYTTWKVAEFNGDSIKFVDDNSMGYDSVCVSVSNDDDSEYCNDGTTGQCAEWEFKITIEDATYGINLCENKDTYEQCMQGDLLSTYTENLNSHSVCDDDYKIEIYYNTSYYSTSGYDTYNNYITNYETIADNCIGSPHDTVNLEISLSYSYLNLCEDCADFIPTDDDDDSATAQQLSLIIGVVTFVMFLLQ